MTQPVEGKPRPFTTLELARKTYAKGFSLTASEESWAAYHLAEQVLDLAARLSKYEEPDRGA